MKKCLVPVSRELDEFTGLRDPCESGRSGRGVHGTQKRVVRKKERRAVGKKRMCPGSEPCPISEKKNIRRKRGGENARVSIRKDMKLKPIREKRD